MTVEDTIERVARAIDDAFDVRAEGNLFLEQAKAALSSLRPGDKLPNGLCVVPEEASEAMLAAAYRACDDNGQVLIKYGYRAMLSAANEKKAD